MILLIKRCGLLLLLVVALSFATFEAGASNVWNGETVAPSKMISVEGVYYYQLTKPEELAYIAENGGEWLNYNYVLANDIVLNNEALTTDKDGNLTVDTDLLKEWKPINNFNGIFNGNGFTISGVYVDGDEEVGFFGDLEGDVYNLNIKNSYIKGTYYVGGICGRHDKTGAVLVGCSFEGTVKGKGCVGGIIGENDCTNIIDCINYGNVYGTEDCVCGVVGYFSAYGIDGCINYGDVISQGDYVAGIAGSSDIYGISECRNYGDITGNNYVGGICGRITDASIGTCINSGVISGNNYVGGICGSTEYGHVESWYSYLSDSFNSGKVSGNSYVGGISGYLNYSEISHCYNLGEIIGNSLTGGVIGKSESIWGKGAVVNCYYAKDKDVNSGINGLGNAEDVQFKTTAKEKSFFCVNADGTLNNLTYEHPDLDKNIICDICGRSINDIEVGLTKLIRKEEYPWDVYLGFTAVQSGLYTLTVDSERDFWLKVYNEDKSQQLHSAYGEISYEIEVGERVYWFVDGEPIDESGVNVLLSYHTHSYTSEVTRKPTCERDGVKTFVCSCGSKYTEIIPSTGEHNWEYSYTDDNGCYSDSYKYYYCDGCDEYKYETIPASGHSMGSWYVYKNATCITNGEKRQDCENCNYYKSETIPSNGKHNLKVIDTIAATCGTNGAKYSICTVCNKTTVEKINATGNHKTETTINRATDTHSGSIIKICTVCDKKVSTAAISKIGSVTLSATKFAYDGKVKTPAVTVKDSSGKTLKKDTDYTVTHASGRKNMGKYTVTVKFKGNYGGTEKLNFTIVPTKVTGVKFSSTSTTAVKLTWNAVSGAAVYRIYRYNTSTKKYDTIALVRGATSCSVSSLKAGTQYKFIVRAYGEVDDNYISGSPSAAITAATKPATPSLKATSTVKGRATLTWTNVAGESGYEVYHSTSKSSGYKKYCTAKANKSGGTVYNLTSGKTYYFRVRAYIKTANGTAYGGYKTVSVKVK